MTVVSFVIYVQYCTSVIIIMYLFIESSSCFPSVATVEVESDKSVTMSDLKIGDRVRTGITNTGMSNWRDKTII